MRIGPAGWAYSDLETVLEKAEEFTSQYCRGGQQVTPAN